MMLHIIAGKRKYGMDLFRTGLLFFINSVIICGKLLSQTIEPGNKNYQVLGAVYDESGKRALGFITVAISRQAAAGRLRETITDSLGRFFLNDLKPGGYLLRFSGVGYQLQEKAISITTADLDVGIIQLKSKAVTLNEVTVTSKKPFIERKIDKVILNVESSAAATGGSVMDVLQTAPGVSVTDNVISLKGKKGVTIMIDGRPGNLSSSDIAGILQNLPAGSVSRIEVIANPSSRYDAAGNAGIINIVTKKLRVRGFNSTVNASAGFGVYPKYNGGGTVNYKENRLNFFGNYFISRNTGFSKYTSKRIIDELVFDETGGSKTNNTSHNYQAGIDFEINSKNAIGASVSGNILNSLFKESFNTDFIQGGKIDSSLLVQNDTRTGYDNISWNLNHELKIDTLGRSLSTNIDYSLFTSHQDGLFNNDYHNAQGQSLRDLEILRNNSTVFIRIGSVKIDYTHPLSNKDMTIQAGLKSSAVRTDSDIKFDIKDGLNWKTDTGKTNHFIFDEFIQAAYLSINKKAGAYEAQVGIRAEQTNNKGNLVTGNLKYGNEYLRLFPTVFISRKLHKAQTLSFSYGRRINRPSYEDLNPFIYYNSPYSFYQGNPFLQPEFTNAFELSYSLNDEFLVSLNYSKTKDYFTYLSYLNDTTKVTRETIGNFKNYISFGSSISLDKDLANWWHISANLDVFYEEFASFYRTMDFKNSITNVNFNCSNEFTFARNNAFVLSGIYRSPAIDGIKRNLARYRIDAGYRKSWFEKRLVLKMAVRDIFYMYRRNGINRIGNLNQEFTNRNDSRVFSIDLTYKFGNQKWQSRKRAKGNTDEMNRIKGMN